MEVAINFDCRYENRTCTLIVENGRVTLRHKLSQCRNSSVICFMAQLCKVLIVLFLLHDTVT